MIRFTAPVSHREGDEITTSTITATLLRSTLQSQIVSYGTLKRNSELVSVALAKVDPP